MPDTFYIEGFETRCDQCGNYYSANYIEFHKQQRCFGKIIQFEIVPNISQNLTKPRLKSNAKLSVISPISSNLPSKKHQKPTFQKSNNNKEIIYINCQFCNVKLKDNRLNKHLTKCSERKIKIKSKKNKKVVQGVIRDCPYCSVKVRIENLENHVSTFHASLPNQITLGVGKSVICSTCKTKHSDLALKCPNCQNIKTRIKPLAPIRKTYKCKHCEHPTMYGSSVCQFCGDK